MFVNVKTKVTEGRKWSRRRQSFRLIPLLPKLQLRLYTRNSKVQEWQQNIPIRLFLCSHHFFLPFLFIRWCNFEIYFWRFFFFFFFKEVSFLFSLTLKWCQVSVLCPSPYKNIKRCSIKDKALGAIERVDCCCWGIWGEGGAQVTQKFFVFCLKDWSLACIN